MLKCSTVIKARTIHSHMPTEREYSQSNPEHKHDSSAFKLMWLRNLNRFDIPYRAVGYSLIVHILAIVGLVYLLS